MKWSYRRAFARCALLIAVGAALQFISGNINSELFRHPVGLILGINYLYLLILLSSRSDKWTWVRQLSSHQACISSLACMLVMTLVIGLTGSRSITTSWIFCILMLYFITVLGMRTIDDIRHRSRHVPLSTIIHTAVFIVLAAAFFSSGDKIRARVTAKAGEPVHVGISPQSGRTVILPYIITLEEFIIEEDPPQFLSRIKVSDSKGEKHLDVKVNHPARTGAWRIYQTGYDRDLGTSTLECIRDGWYPVVRVGLWIMLLAGAGMVLTAGSKRRREDRE